MFCGPGPVARGNVERGRRDCGWAALPLCNLSLRLGPSTSPWHGPCPPSARCPHVAMGWRWPWGHIATRGAPCSRAFPWRCYGGKLASAANWLLIDLTRRPSISQPAAKLSQPPGRGGLRRGHRLCAMGLCCPSRAKPQLRLPNRNSLFFFLLSAQHFWASAGQKRLLSLSLSPFSFPLLFCCVLSFFFFHFDLLREKVMSAALNKQPLVLSLPPARSVCTVAFLHQSRLSWAVHG